MNETQVYSAIMFFAGVALTHAVFYFERKTKEKKFYLFLSAIILQALDNIHLVHQAAIEFAQDRIKTIDETDLEKYLQEEREKLSVFMELYVLLFINSVPQKGRKYLKYKSWHEAATLIKEMRGFLNNEKGKR